MEKNHILSIFNKQFKEFVEDISRVFPTNSDISAFKTIIGQLLTITPKIIIKTFKKHVADKYQAEIEAGDINFFINKDYNGDLANSGNNTILEKIDCLRGPVKEMNPAEQAKVIKYLQNMAKLCQLHEEAA